MSGIDCLKAIRKIPAAEQLRMSQQQQCQCLTAYLTGGYRYTCISSFVRMTHRKVDQVEEAAVDRLWRGVHEAQICHLASPECLAPMRRQFAGRILETPAVCALLAYGDCDVCAQGYELLHCKQTS